MRIYLDCEFNGFGGQLLSLALVAENGKEWYGVMPEPSVWDEWVLMNVKPLLYYSAKGADKFDTRNDFRRSMHEFLMQFDNPTIVADWYADFIHFFSCFQGNDHSESIAYACKTELILLDNYESEYPHHALSDARAIKQALEKSA